MTDISFSVIGEPVSKGSTVSHVAKKGDGSLVFRDGKPVIVTHDQSGYGGKAAERVIANAALVARNRAGMPLLRTEAVEVRIKFYRPRNVGHYGTGRNAGLLKDSAPARPAVMPDLDKLTRHVLDALTGVIYRDDGQVVTILATKAYAEGDTPPRTEISVRPCKAQAVAQLVAGELQMELTPA